MFSKYLLLIAFLFFGTSLIADEPAPIAGPFGSKPLSLTIGPGGVNVTNERYICTISTMNANYQEWGATEKDARGLLMEKCTKGSGLLLCKRDKISCKLDK